MNSFELAVNGSISAHCSKCHVEIDIPYSLEEILSGKTLTFTCKNCGAEYSQELLSAISGEALKALRDKYQGKHFKF